MVARRSRRSSSQRARAASASSSTACREPRRAATRRGLGPSRCPSASPRECAGSVETTRTLRPDSARPTAAAAEHVVLPTPPLPPKKRKTAVGGGGRDGRVRREPGRRSAPPAVLRLALVLPLLFRRLVLVPRERRLDAGDLHLAGGRSRRAVALAHL